MLKQPFNNHRVSLIIGQSTPGPTPAPLARQKEWPLVVLLLLIPLVAAAGLVHLLRTVPSGLIQQEFEGLGAALGAAACGVVLIWRVVRAMALQQRLQSQPLVDNQASLSSSEPNPAEPQKVHSSLPPEAAAAPAAPVASLPIATRT